MKFLFTSSFLLLALSIVSGTTVEQVKSDISTIDSAVASLNSQLQSSSLNYFSALAIHNAAVAVDDKIKSGTSDVQALTTAPTTSDAEDIITMLTGTETNVKSATDQLVALKSQLDSLGVAGIAKGDINSLQMDTKAFGAALVNAAPTEQKQEAQSLADKFNADLANAAAAYN